LSERLTPTPTFFYEETYDPLVAERRNLFKVEL
jgi:hypothetical protein